MRACGFRVVFFPRMRACSTEFWSGWHCGVGCTKWARLVRESGSWEAYN